MRTIIITVALALTTSLAACDQGQGPTEPTVEHRFAQGVVRAQVDEAGELVAEVVDHQGHALATVDFSLPQAEGTLVLEDGGVHELSFDPSEPLEVDGVCEVAYRLTTGDQGDDEFRVQHIGCDYGGPGCCFIGAGGYFCEVCWGTNGYSDTYCGPAVY